MKQRNFDFNNDESHTRFLQLDTQQQQSLIDLMATLITIVFQQQEKTHHDKS